MVIPPTGNSHVSGSLVGGVFIHLLTPEHHRAVHRDRTHHVSVYGGVAAPWGEGVPESVVTDLDLLFFTSKMVMWLVAAIFKIQYKN